MARYIPGGRVVLADGTYEFGGSVSLNKQKAHLQGMGGATHIRPSATGFDRLIQVDEVHCRVGWLMLFDSGDTVHDLRYALVDNAQWWTIVESVHSHGAEFSFEDATGPGVYQVEIHPQPAAGDNPGSHGVRFYGTDPANSLYCDWGRVHGGWIDEVRFHALNLIAARNCSIEGTDVHRASMEDPFSYDAVRLHRDNEDCSVIGSHINGDGYCLNGVNERSGQNNYRNSVLGNRIEGSSSSSGSDLVMGGTDSKSAANHADGTIK